MLLTLTGHSFRYECENLCRLFFPYSPVVVNSPESPKEGEPEATAVIENENGQYVYRVEISQSGRSLQREGQSSQLAEFQLTELIYQVFSQFTGATPAWGMLTGIHPVKFLRSLGEAWGEEEALRLFQEKYYVSREKAELAARVLQAQKPSVDCLSENDFSLYVSIPFCPSRCSYCSFVSQSIEQAQKLVEPYFQLLLEEIRKTAQVAKSLSLRLITVYIGGGTPTTLSAPQLLELCQEIHAQFDFSHCREFTVEAGRPDTIDEAKLLALMEGGVGRISINPQTLSGQVLENIGRKHSPQDIADAFALAREIGFTNINADLIVGLPGDDLPGFQKSLQGVIALGASNITVHSLALKRSANLVSEGGDLSLHSKSAETAAMVDYSIDTLTRAGFVPYYLYRQSRMAGNLENTGWARPGTVCSYNVYTMDESNSVIACGAGGVTKLKDPYSDRIERIFNFKYPYEYISRNAEILERKEGVISLYEQFRQRLH